ncbi:MAG: radical SAM protein [Candidatus Omnitrophica bacterium]|nr:radical SAM protein [Candidatus Omnitrophota bacterium]
MGKQFYVQTKNIRESRFIHKKLLISRLDIELAERCNNNCIHCYINLPADDLLAKEKELSTAEIKNILKEAVSLGCLVVRFTGGEPLLRKDFEEVYIFARRCGLKVMLFTNATLITPHLAELFCHIPPLEKIEVTLYGMKKDSYEAATRVSGSFEAAQRGINLLLEKKIPFVVKGALLPSNKEEIDEFEAWAKIIPWMGKPPAYAMFFDLRCRRDVRKNELIKKVRLSADEGLKILTRNKSRYIKEMKIFCAKFIRPPKDKIFSCGAGCGGGCVDAYGKFQLCMMLRHPDTVYNLRCGSLKDALENFFPKIRKIKATNREYLSRCANCFLKGLCEQCPAKSWEEHGTLDTPVEYFCEIAHTQARFLGLIEKDEKAWEVNNWKKRISDFVKRDVIN